MKPLLLLLIPLFLNANILSPDAQAILRGSPMTSSENSRAMRSGTGTISGMIMINSSFDEGAFSGIGGEIITRTDEVCTVNLPYSALAKLNSVKGIEYFSPARKVNSRLDKALPAGGLITAHEGLPSGNAYTGKGVVVGIIDGGFDFRHPSFFNSSMNKTRITRVWDQLGWKKGALPQGYQYGREYDTNEEIMDVQLSQGFSSSHGTHVAGIAAGAKVGLGSVTSVGVAPEAELVFVAVNFYDNGIVDGMRYIFDYAESVGKPAVINISLGSHYGPHDGSSAIDRIIEAFTGPGKIVVGSAGNERGQQVHISKDAGESSVKSFFTVPYYESGNTYLQMLPVWGELDKNFSVKVALYNSNGRLLSTSNSFSVSDIVNSGGVNGSLNTQGYGDFKYFLFGTEKSPLNNRPEVVVQVESNSSYVSEQFHATLELSGEGEVHAWTYISDTNSVPDFYSNEISGFVMGDTTFTVGEVGGTGRETISVGAYNSRTSYENLWGESKGSFGKVEGDIAPFSSMGPTVDNRLKPDITAPGDVLVSPLRSDYKDSSASYGNVAYEMRFSGIDYPYGGMSGTSMSAPFITGTVALMLEANPKLTPSQIKDILKQSAVRDGLNIDSKGSYSWGWGKVNVDAALDLVEDTRNLPKELIGGGAAPTLRSMRSGKMELKLESPVVKTVDIRVMDLRGRELVRRSVSLAEGVNQLPIDVKSLAPGTYLYQVNGVGINSIGKVVHLR